MSREINFDLVYKGETGFHHKKYHLCELMCGINKICDIHHMMELVATRQYTGFKDLNGRDIYEGDILRYADLYECHSDAVDYYGVEPQNNFPVSEVYPEYKEGVVEFDSGAYKVNGIYLSELNTRLQNKIEDCYFMGNFGCSSRDFISTCHEFGFPSPVRREYTPEIVGNIFTGKDGR